MIDLVIDKFREELIPHFNTYDSFSINLTCTVDKLNGPFTIANPHGVNIKLRHRANIMCDILELSSFVDNKTNYYDALIKALEYLRIQNRQTLNDKNEFANLTMWQVEVREHLHIALDETLKYAGQLSSYREVQV